MLRFTPDGNVLLSAVGNRISGVDLVQEPPWPEYSHMVSSLNVGPFWVPYIRRDALEKGPLTGTIFLRSNQRRVKIWPRFGEQVWGWVERGKA